jgi:hypothetical protein
MNGRDQKLANAILLLYYVETEYYYIAIAITGLPPRRI